MIIRFHLIFICRLFRIDSDVIIQYNAAYANKITDINYMSKAEDNSRIKVIVRFRPIN
jgi:kinesin family protein 5